MSKRHRLFSSESVTEGHPDKIADQIADGVLDAIYKQDKYGRVACEVMVTTGMAIIAGEITTTARIEVPRIARDIIKEIGYTDASYGFDYETCAVLTSIDEQSPDIARGVKRSEEREQGAGDQGMMYGYATDETPERMPAPILLAHKLTRRLAEVRKEGILDFIRPDGKAQITVEYVDERPTRIVNVVVSTQHSPDVTGRDGAMTKKAKAEVVRDVIKHVLPQELAGRRRIDYFINPTGRFVVGGPQGDCGLTGRKIIVDTYGGMGRHGGGAFSGKDPSKVDRSAAYMMRHVAKNIVAARLAKRCETQVAYAIGVAEPVSVYVDTFGTGVIPDERLAAIVLDIFDFRPAKIIEYLNLRRPIYKKTAAYGHFGREERDFTWERVNRAKDLRKAAKTRSKVR
jgi:S-adenosylmethionine synthetase